MSFRGVMLFGFCFLVGAVSHARAAEIYSTFGAGGTFSVTTYTPVNFYVTPTETIGTQLAFAFSVPGGPDYNLEAVELAASWAGTKKNALFLLYADAAGVPAADPLQTLAVNPDALLEYPDITIVTLPAPAPLTLQGGAQYWFSIAPASLDPTGAPEDFVELWLNPDDLLTTQTSRTWFDTGPWGDWYSPAIQTVAPAFRVLASPVPVPPTLPLMLVSMVVAGACGWRRRAV